MGKSVIITGGTSFLGTALLRELLRHGYECYAIVRRQSVGFAPEMMEHPGFHVIQGELSNPDKFEQRLPMCDLFYHLAWAGVGAQERADRMIQQRNVSMAVTCMRLAARKGAKRFLFAGSQAEYGDRSNLMKETDACNPVIEYGKGKLQVLQKAQNMAAELGFEYVHMRIFSIYGAGDHSWTLVNTCMDAFIKDERISLSSGTQMWNFLYVGDAAVMMRRLGEAIMDSRVSVVNVASEDTRRLKDFVDSIWRAAGKRGKPEYGTLENTLEKPHGIQPDTTGLQRLIAWTPTVTFEQRIRELMVLKASGRINA